MRRDLDRAVKAAADARAAIWDTDGPVDRDTLLTLLDTQRKAINMLTEELAAVNTEALRVAAQYLDDSMGDIYDTGVGQLIHDLKAIAERLAPAAEKVRAAAK